MEKEIRKKAIEQAQASLNIDKIYLSKDYITSYFHKHQLPIQLPRSKKLIFIRGKKNGK